MYNNHDIYSRSALKSSLDKFGDHCDTFNYADLSGCGICKVCIHHVTGIKSNFGSMMYVSRSPSGKGGKVIGMCSSTTVHWVNVSNDKTNLHALFLSNCISQSLSTFSINSSIFCPLHNSFLLI